MQTIKGSISRHLGIRIPLGNQCGNMMMYPNMYLRQLCMSGDQCSDKILGRVIELVMKFEGIDGTKVTEKADFQKDLSLDSLDKVELVMALEQEFSVEIPDEKAEKLTCCAEVARYIISESKSN